MPGALKGQRAYSPGQSISDTPGFNACKGCRPEWAKALYAKRKLFIDNMLYDIVILSANAFALPGRKSCTRHYTHGVAMGYALAAPSGRTAYEHIEIMWDGLYNSSNSR